MLKILSSEISEDFDISYMPAIEFFACLDFEQVSADSENPTFARGSVE
jgi:hypothetical protein